MRPTSTRRAGEGWSWRAAGVTFKFQQGVVTATTPERHKIGAVDIFLGINVTIGGGYVSRFQACQGASISPRPAWLVAIIAIGCDFAELVVDRDALNLQLPGVD